MASLFCCPKQSLPAISRMFVLLSTASGEVSLACAIQASSGLMFFLP